MRTGVVAVPVVALLVVASSSGAAPPVCALGVPTLKLGVQGVASGPHADYGRQIEMGA